MIEATVSGVVVGLIFGALAIRRQGGRSSQPPERAPWTLCARCWRDWWDWRRPAWLGGPIREDDPPDPDDGERIDIAA